MTGDTGEMRPNTDQCVRVAVRTGHPANSHQGGMIRGDDMGGGPSPGVADGAIPAGGKVFANGKASQAAVHSVTAGTPVVSILSSAGQGVVVTGRTTGCRHLDQ